MNKTLKKTLSIILTILMIVTTVPFAFAVDCVHDYSGEHFCLGYYCGNCNSYYGEPNPNGHYWFGEQCGICYETHEHRGNAGTICMGTLCELCYYPYGEVTDPDAHKWNSDGTCGYCEAECEHPSYTDGVCDDCGYICPHEGYTDGKCEVCGADCPHEGYIDGKCEVCGSDCPHESVTDGKCDDCGAEGTFVTITMNDSYGDGWNGNVVKIEQLIDGVYTEVATATIEDGASETYTAVLPKDGIYAYTWVSGSYPDECSFTVKVNGEIVFEAEDCSELIDGQLIYVNCEHTGGAQTCKGFKCEVCMQWYGETGEHTAEGEQTCIGTLCSVCREWYGEAGEQHDLSTEQTCMGYKCNLCYGYFGEASEHDLSSEQTCLGYYCYSCDEYYGEADPDAHRWNDTYCYICEEEHDHTGGTQTCRGYKCEICQSWYGEAGEQHDLSTEQTCMGYKCNLCYGYFGETGDHSPYTEQTCMGYGCEYCYEWFGEADTSKHSWYYGYCDYCEIEYPADEECIHDLDSRGQCIICGYQCPHDTMENGTCTSCSYILPFSLTTDEIVTYHGSFADALDKAEDGSVIKLLKDHDDYNSLEINKAITLDLNGKEWIQPSSGGFDVTANATFTDSVGGGYLDYALYLYSPVTLSGGTYKYIGIRFETEDTIGDYLADCCACFDHYTDELIDVTGEYVLGAKIKANHNLGEQTCMGCKCEDCGEWFGEVDADAHDWSNVDGVCANGCGTTCDHTGGEATCTAKAVCETCGVEYGDIDKDNHKDTLVPVEAKAKTCTEIGWDAYEYCTACDYSTYVEIPASHEIKTVDKKDATCTQAGHEAYEYCTECDYTTYKEISSNGHTPLEAAKENEVAPKCGVAGSYDLVVYCDVCGEELDRDTTTVDALTHTDSNGDYLCDHGCGHEFEKPAEPDTPDEPSDGDCDHLCHKSGFMGFIWKIIRFFQKLFRIQQYCDCGVAHW